SRSRYNLPRWASRSSTPVNTRDNAINSSSIDRTRASLALLQNFATELEFVGQSAGRELHEFLQAEGLAIADLRRPLRILPEERLAVVGQQSGEGLGNYSSAHLTQLMGLHSRVTCGCMIPRFRQTVRPQRTVPFEHLVDFLDLLLVFLCKIVGELVD